MERNETPNIDQWVEDRLTALTPPDDWQPNIAVGLALLGRGRPGAGGWRKRSAYVLATATIVACLLAFPVTRVLANRCIDACAAGTSAVRDFLWTRPHPSSPAPEGLIRISERRMASDFSLSDASGRLVRLADFRGRVVLLNFWATWCFPCNLEVPWFVEFQQKYRDVGLVVLGVAMDDDGWKPVKPYINEHRVNYPVMVADDKIARTYGGIESLPTTVLIDKAGRVAVTHTGVVDKQTYEEDLSALFAER